MSIVVVIVLIGCLAVVMGELFLPPRMGRKFTRYWKDIVQLSFGSRSSPDPTPVMTAEEFVAPIAKTQPDVFETAVEWKPDISPEREARVEEHRDRFAQGRYEAIDAAPPEAPQTTIPTEEPMPEPVESPIPQAPAETPPPTEAPALQTPKRKRSPRKQKPIPPLA